MPQKSKRRSAQRIASAVLCALFLCCALAPACRAESPVAALRAALNNYLSCFRLELVALEKQQPAIRSRNFCLTEIYDKKNPQPFWVSSGGPGERARVILDFLKRAEAEGLDPRNYEVNQIAALFAERKPVALAKLDTLLTYNLIKYIHDVRSGPIKPRYVDPGLFPEAGDINFKPRENLEHAINAVDLAAYLESLPPAHGHYIGLKKALMMYRAIEQAGGWPLISAGPKIEPGTYDVRIPDIVRRLSATGDMDPMMVRGPLPVHCGPSLEKAIARFQRRHGLDPDSIIGKKTLAAMNIPVAEKIKQIIINMTRWRWQERDLGEKYILVNIAHFDLIAIDAQQHIFNCAVIVGKFKQQTPVFSNRISYIDINPYWNVPPSIARNEDLPKLRKDSGSLEKRHIRLFSDWTRDAVEIDPKAVDWHAVSPARMGQYHLRQDPGPWNALGQIKFVFPNKYKVYLHDTPTQKLFARSQRNFSHGCIRVSEPEKLAAVVLSGQDGGTWTVEKVKSSINTNERRIIKLAQPLPIHITYQTAWIDKTGIVCFNYDVYGRDKKLLRAFRE